MNKIKKLRTSPLDLSPRLALRPAPQHIRSTLPLHALARPAINA